MDFEIIWQGNPITCMKSFGKLSCLLCMRERMEILTRAKKNPDKQINSCGEIYGACRHNPKFHRYTMNNQASTDDGFIPERALGEKNDEENLTVEIKKPPVEMGICHVMTVAVV